jgi:hypothetical protein
MASNPELDSKVIEPGIKLEVSVNELNVIFAALQELPHRVSDPILKKLFGQAQPQVQG